MGSLKLSREQNSSALHPGLSDKLLVENRISLLKTTNKTEK